MPATRYDVSRSGNTLGAHLAFDNSVAVGRSLEFVPVHKHLSRSLKRANFHARSAEHSQRGAGYHFSVRDGGNQASAGSTTLLRHPVSAASRLVFPSRIWPQFSSLMGAWRPQPAVRRRYRGADGGTIGGGSARVVVAGFCAAANCRALFCCILFITSG